MKLVPLTKGYEAMVDDEDYDRVMKYKWTASISAKTVYALHHFNSKATGRGAIGLHRFIMNASNYLTVDHIDFNGLNCQKNNLRLATRTQQVANRRAFNQSGYKGVYRYKRKDKTNNRWQAMIRIDGYLQHIGMYLTAEDAAKAYDNVAKKAFGEFAFLNFPGEK